MRALPRRTFLRAAALSPLVAACSTGPSRSGGAPQIPNTDVNPWGVNTFLHLDADWQSGDDRVDLDNVRFCSGDTACLVQEPPGPQVPLPATLMLVIAGGMAGLRVAARRRR